MPVTIAHKGFSPGAARVTVAPTTTTLLLLILTFSGGGTRAAALAYGVLEQMRADEVQHDGRSHRLIEDIDGISSVSGGSITAAYIALHGDRLCRDFRTEFLEHDVERDLWWAVAASPRSWLRLGSGEYSRGDLFADYLDRRLFAGARGVPGVHRSTAAGRQSGLHEAVA